MSEHRESSRDEATFTVKAGLAEMLEGGVIIEKVRKLADIAWRFYAAPGYLEAHGRPRTLRDLGKHQLIGWGEAMQPTKAAAWLNRNMTDGQVFGYRTGSLVNRMLAYDWRYTLAENDLPKVVGTTQLAQTSVGFPFLDPQLLALSLRMPPDAKLKRLKLRWFFKEALRGFLPDQIITKKKQGFGLPFGVWAMRDEKLHRLAADSLGSLAARGIVRPAFLQQLLDEQLPEHPSFYGEMVWILMMFEQWLQRHAPHFAFER